MNNKKKIIVAIICSLLYGNIFAQSPYIHRRDWVIGTYSGYTKDSTANSAWAPYSFYIDYTQYFMYPLDDSTVYNHMSGSMHLISNDSTFLSRFGFLDPTSVGRLHANDSLYFTYVVPFTGGGHQIYFKGIKTSSSVGILHDEIEDNMIPFPNPINNKLYLRMPLNKSATIKILNIKGREILYEEMLLNRKKIFEKDLSFLPNGIYFLQVISDDAVETKKIIVEHE